MKLFKKIFSVFAFFILFQTSSFGADLNAPINKILNSFDFDRDSVVSISIKSKETGLPVYEKGAHKFLNPASSLKLFTMAASLDTLGDDYTFKTAFYKDKKNNIYLKLSGDPLFSSEDLNTLSAELKLNNKGRINKIYIDDSIIDSTPYPDGWTVDDYWPNSPKLSPYMVDSNTVKVDFYYNEDKKEVRILQRSPYKFSFINKLTPSSSTNIKFLYDELLNTVNVEGTISKSVTNKEIPVMNPKYFFCMKLAESLNKKGINYNDKFLFARVPNDAVLVAKFDRKLEEVIKHTLETSDNVSAEMVFKVAGGKYAKEKSPVSDGFNSFGTTQNGINMFMDYYNKLGVDSDKVIMRDGSGVSRYNAINTNWMTNALLKMNFDYEKYLPTAGTGTLSRRMRELNGKVYLKTGTLFGTSSLTGVIKTDEGEFYYSSVIMSFDRNKSLIKGIEDEIVYEVYRNFENEE